MSSDSPAEPPPWQTGPPPDYDPPLAKVLAIAKQETDT